MADDEPVPPAAAALIDQLELFIPLAGVIDQEAEKLRLEKELNKLTKEYESVQGRLNNPNYLAKAPADVVAKERLRAQELQANIEKLQVQQGSWQGSLIEIPSPHQALAREGGERVRDEGVGFRFGEHYDSKI